jgi:uncharacterized membrane protein YjjP (DUF1212 family)
MLEVAFLTRLGSALSAAGDPVSSTERTLQRLAHCYAMEEVEIGVLPTLVFVRAKTGDAPSMDLAAADADAEVRLDQIDALYEIVHLAQTGRLSASDGLVQRFVGATTMTVTAFCLERLPNAPPFQVLFLPAFLAPGPGCPGGSGVCRSGRK